MGKLGSSTALCHYHAVLWADRAQQRTDHLMQCRICQGRLPCGFRTIVADRCWGPAQGYGVEGQRKARHQHVGVECRLRRGAGTPLRGQGRGPGCVGTGHSRIPVWFCFNLGAARRYLDERRRSGVQKVQNGHK